MSKFKKLFNDPHQYLIDSKYKSFRYIATLVKSDNQPITKRKKISKKKKYPLAFTYQKDPYKFIPFKPDIIETKEPDIIETKDKVVRGCYLVINWKKELNICEKIANKLELDIVSFTPFSINSNISEENRNLNHMLNNSYDFRTYIKHQLIKIPYSIKGIITTNDIDPVIREVIDVANLFKIPTKLFIVRNNFGMQKFYENEKYGYAKPISKELFIINDSQKLLMKNKGYNSETIKVIGNLLPSEDSQELTLNSVAFKNIYNFSKFKKIVLVNLKNSKSTEELVLSLFKNISYLLNSFNIQFVFFGTSKILNDNKEKLIKLIQAQKVIIIKDKYNKANTQTLLSSADIVISNSSVILFSSLMCNRVTISLDEDNKFITDNIIYNVGSIINLYDVFTKVLDKDMEKIAIPRTALSCEDKACEDTVLITQIKNFKSIQDIQGISLNRHKRVGLNISISRNLISNFKYTDILLNADTLVNLYTGDEEVDEMAIWGMGLSPKAQRIKNKAIKKNIPFYYLENGFITSLGLTAADELPSISILKDSKNLYYNALYGSELEDLINCMPDLTVDENNRSAKLIKMIIDNYITKYNHAPIFKPSISSKNKHKVLVIDQRYGDKSIEYGMASSESFNLMLESAISENPNSDIIIKVHPDAILGGKEGHYFDIKENNNLFLYGENINPLALLKYIDKVYVCTSQMGFEALMCKKEVVCFGVPFYSGWGLTDDRIICERRGDNRTLEQVFKAAYIDYSTYMNPYTNKICEIEEALEYISSELNKRDNDV